MDLLMMYGGFSFLDKYYGRTGDKEYFTNSFYVPTRWIVFFFYYCVILRQALEYY